MKFKRAFAFVSAVLLLAIFAQTSFCAMAVTFDKEKMQISPGNTQSDSPVYSKSWLDKLIVRDDAMAATTARMVPKADYPYETTYEDFVKDVNNYTILNALNENTLKDSFDLGLKAFYYVVTAMGMTADFDKMYSYVSKKGIRVPANIEPDEKVELAVVYASIKYKAVYVLYGRNVTFPKGTTLDEASAIILSELGGFSIPSSVKSVSGLALYFMQNYIEEYDVSGSIPISDNPDVDELFHWVRAVAATKQGYVVPMIPYDQTTQVQRDYVDYAYYATIFDTLYDIHINPFALVKADNEGDVTSIPRLILTTMLDEKNVEYSADARCENLFDLACKQGYFDLDEEFYSDIFNYDLYVAKDCKKLWVTPFALADQLGGSNKNIKIKVGKKKISPAGTTYIPLDTSKKTEKVKIVVTYDDGVDEAQETTYTFNIIKTKKKALTSDGSNNIVSKVEEVVRGAVPDDNEKVDKIVDNIFGAVNNAAKSDSPATTAKDNSNNVPSTKGEISTYNNNTTYAVDESETQGDEDREDHEFGYLSQLFEETYALDENTSHSSYMAAQPATGEQDDTVVEKTVTAIKENPEIVAAPTGVITFGALAGYLFTRKKKPTLDIDDETSAEDSTEW